MIPIKIGKEIDFELPTCYDELTFNQFFKLKELKENDNIGFLSTLSGLDRDIWVQCSDIDIVYKLYPMLEWMQDPFSVETFIPDYLTIDGVRYKRPKGLGIGAFGQVEHLKVDVKEIGDRAGQDYEAFPIILAVVMQPIIDNKPYSYDRALELMPSIMNCKLGEAWPLASFFLTNLVRYSERRKDGFQVALNRKKSKLALMSSKSSVRGLQFSFWRRILIASQKKFSNFLTRMYLRRYSPTK